MLDWARRAESAGFSTLGTLDRIVYPNWEPLIALAAAAAVTERIGSTTAILIVPYRESAAIVAEQTATIHALSGGRLVLGAAIGSRDDDYTPFGLSTRDRGRRMDEMLEEIKRLWAGEERGYAGGVGPDVSADPPPIIVGGRADAALMRAARFGEGWMMGGAPAETFPDAVEQLRAAWRAAGRQGEPRRMAPTYFSLDDDAEAQTRRTIGHCYASAGGDADIAVAGTAKGRDEAQERVRAFEEAGCDELIMFGASSDPEQVDRLAAVAL